MPLYMADALILRTYKLGEADRIVVFLTSDRGKRRGVAKGARRLRSRFSGGLESFTLARLAYVERENRELVRLSYVEPVMSPLVGMNAEALGYSGYFSELIDEWALEGDPSNRLYRLGASVATALSSGMPVGRIVPYFEYWLLRLQGVYPSIVMCHRCGGALDKEGAVMAPDAAGFMCPRCAPGDQSVDLSADALTFLRAAAACPPDGIAELVFAPRTAKPLAYVHHRLIATHLEKELKSARVLRDLGTAISGVPPMEPGTA